MSKGARILNGGFIPKGEDELAKGSFYPPTVLCDVPENALIAQKEIFGPIMCIFKVIRRPRCSAEPWLSHLALHS